ATSLAPLIAEAPNRRSRDEDQTGPHSRTRRSPSTNTTARTATRNSSAYAGRAPSSRTVSANPTRATGGRIARSGLPARIARAWIENDAVHTAVTAARSNGGSGGAG